MARTESSSGTARIRCVAAFVAPVAICVVSPIPFVVGQHRLPVAEGQVSCTSV